MKEITLWEPQRLTAKRTGESLRAGKRAVLVQQPTGTGKTRVAAYMIQRFLVRNRSCLFIAPRRELIYQASETFASFGMESGTIMAEEEMSPFHPLQVASFDTLHQRAMKRKKIPLPRAHCVFVDEAHLSITRTREAILRKYAEDGSIIIGLTATPARGDGRGLGIIYDDIVSVWPMQRYIQEGYLLQPQYWTPTKPDLEGVKVANDGDYVTKDLSKRMNKPRLVGDLYKHWIRITGGNVSSVIYCVDCAHARSVEVLFRSKGVATEYVDSETDTEERKALMERMRSGQSKVLVNVDVATYGLDIPILQACIIARPTRHITRYMQMVGRVLRIYDGQEFAYVIDHAGVYAEHLAVEYPVEWTLHGNMRIVTQKQRDRDSDFEPFEIQCPECDSVIRSAKSCHTCGWELPPKIAACNVFRGDLVKVERGDPVMEQMRFYARIKGYAIDYGKSSGWCAQKYRQKFKEWPQGRVRTVPPEPPDDEIKSWVKGMNIRYWKRQGLRG